MIEIIIHHQQTGGQRAAVLTGVTLGQALKTVKKWLQDVSLKQIASHVTGLSKH